MSVSLGLSCWDLLFLQVKLLHHIPGTDVSMNLFSNDGTQVFHQHLAMVSLTNVWMFVFLSGAHPCSSLAYVSPVTCKPNSQLVYGFVPGVCFWNKWQIEKVGLGAHHETRHRMQYISQKFN